MAIERIRIKKQKSIPTHKSQTHIMAYNNITNDDLLILGVKLPSIFSTLAEAIDIMEKITNGYTSYLTGREIGYIYAYDFFVTKSGYMLTRPKDVFVKLLKLTKRLENIELEDGINKRLKEHYHTAILQTSNAILDAVREENS